MSELVLIEAILKQTITGKMDIDALIEVLDCPGLDSSIANNEFINSLIYKMANEEAFEIDVDDEGDLVLREVDDNSIYHQLIDEIQQILSKASNLEEFKEKISESDLFPHFMNDNEIKGVYTHFTRASHSNYKSMLFPKFSDN